MNNNIENEINRLNFEDILWVIFILLSIMNIVSNGYQKEYVVSGNEYYEDRAGNISIFVLTVLFFVYLYFFIRNYNMYNSKSNPTNADLIKVIGSLFSVIGPLCLLYFQIHSDDNFISGSEL